MTTRARTRVLTVTVTDVIQETVDASSLVFGGPAVDDGDFTYRAGQFVTVRVPSEQTGSVARCYSLASTPLASEPPKVTVKRTSTGYASNWLCDNVGPGDELQVLAPAGLFTPHDLDAELLLLAAGSGITPMMSIVKSALLSGAPSVTLVYANRDPDSIIFRAELDALSRQHQGRLLVLHLLESVQGLPDAHNLASLIAPYLHRHAFMCGPAPFMDAVRRAYDIAGVSQDLLHAEVFRSLSGDPFAEPDTETGTAEEISKQETSPPSRLAVNLDGEDHEIAWPRNKTLVDAMLDHGLDVPYSCRSGECGSCACTVVSGNVEMPPSDVLDDDDIADGYILGCQARPTSDSVSITF